ncbi:hypothetical protein [Photobacterium leiognathi]|uniref:hypothetical protein n=1 Tax=Photobacterium leiognathi TaxID=553611 RepID=UPI000D1738B6|nr:hypothetical protein [Photobacterium leiognathi]PSW53046.1 hypothetical protein C0W50_19755 [Photobacterium leiognathi subsp. mandapamensis]
MNNDIMQHSANSTVTFPANQQRLAVRTVNREAAKMMAIEALARHITDLSSSTVTAEKFEQIQLAAEAMMYQIEDARAALTNVALLINDLDVE